MPHLVSTVHALAARGVGFRSLAESIDTTSATGRLVLHLFAALADFERGLIVERTKASLTAKRQRGEPLGRPRALTPAQVREARGMIERGKTIAYAARALRCGRATWHFTADSSRPTNPSLWRGENACGFFFSRPNGGGARRRREDGRAASPRKTKGERSGEGFPAHGETARAKRSQGDDPETTKEQKPLDESRYGSAPSSGWIASSKRNGASSNAMRCRSARPPRSRASLQQCVHCRKDIVLLVFGDNARDAAGLEAYARLMAEPIQKTNLPAYIIAPPADPSSLDNPALLLKVYPVQEGAVF